MWVYDKFQPLNPGEISLPHFQCAALTFLSLLCLEVCGICFALSQKNTGKLHSHFSSSLFPGLRGNALFHFLLFLQLRPYLPTLNNNISPYLWLVQCVTSSRTKQTAAFPKTWIVFKKFSVASCLESPSLECCFQNPLLSSSTVSVVTTVSICLWRHWSLSRVPKQHGFGLTAPVTASVTSSAPSPPAVTALPSLLADISGWYLAPVGLSALFQKMTEGYWCRAIEVLVNMKQ